MARARPMFDPDATFGLEPDQVHHGRARVQPPQICKKRRHGRVADQTGAEIRRNGAAQPEDVVAKSFDPDRQRKRVGFLPVDLPPEDPRRVVRSS